MPQLRIASTMTPMMMMALMLAEARPYRRLMPQLRMYSVDDDTNDDGSQEVANVNEKDIATVLVIAVV